MNHMPVGMSVVDTRIKTFVHVLWSDNRQIKTKKN